MMALFKFVVLLAIFLLQPMSDPMNKPSREPTCKPTNDRINDQTTNQTMQWLEQDALLPDNLSSKRFLFQVSVMDDVIKTCKAHSEYTQSYQVAILVPFISFRSKSFGLAYCWVHSHQKTTVDLFQAFHCIQFACIKRSFTYARVFISTFDGLTLSSRMACWVCTLRVKVPLLHQTNHAVPSEWWHKQQHYVPFAFCWDLHQSAKAALKAIAEVQASTDKTKPNNASSFNDKPSSTFQLVVASSIGNQKPFQTNYLESCVSKGIKSKMPFIFQLIVGSKQMHQIKLQQVRVDAWLSNTISGHGPNSHESNCTSQLAMRSKCLKPHKSSCASKVACAKCLNSHKSSCASKVARAKCLNSHESSCASLLVAIGGPQEKMSFFQIASGPILSIPIHSKTCLYGRCKFSLKKNDPFLTYEPPKVSFFFIYPC